MPFFDVDLKYSQDDEYKVVSATYWCEVFGSSENVELFLHSFRRQYILAYLLDVSSYDQFLYAAVQATDRKVQAHRWKTSVWIFETPVHLPLGTYRLERRNYEQGQSSLSIQTHKEETT